MARDSRRPWPKGKARHTFIRPGRPQTNGHVERLHRTIPEACWGRAFVRYLRIPREHGNYEGDVSPRWIADRLAEKRA